MQDQQGLAEGEGPPVPATESSVYPEVALEFVPPTVNRAVRTAVLEHLRRMITLGRLRPGERLLQVQLAAELGVSRMPVRDAISDLQQEGLVVQLPRGGVAVAPISAADAESIYSLRWALERYAVIQAVQNARSEHFDLLDACIRRYEAVIGNADVELFLKLDREFHSIIYDMTSNRFLESSMAPVWSQAQRLNLLLLQTRDYHVHAWAQHRALSDFLRQRDLESAMLMMERHLADAYNQFAASGLSLDDVSA